MNIVVLDFKRAQMDLSDRPGRDGSDLAGMAWDEMSLVPVVTSSVLFTATKVYKNNRCGALEIELYTGISKQASKQYLIIFCRCFDSTLAVAKTHENQNFFNLRNIIDVDN